MVITKILLSKIPPKLKGISIFEEEQMYAI